MKTDLAIPTDLSILEKSIFIAKSIKRDMDVLRPLVYQVYKDELWRERFGSFGEYVESQDGLGLSQSYASKLKAVEEHFVIEGGVSPEKIAGIDYECLYLAAKTGGTIEEQVEKARTLTRRELKEDKNDGEPCEHEPIKICKKCHLRMID